MLYNGEVLIVSILVFVLMVRILYSSDGLMIRIRNGKDAFYEG